MYRGFYEEIDRETKYSLRKKPEDHGSYLKLVEFIDTYGLQDKKCLEIGSGTGLFQDLVPDYVGVDIAKSLASYYHKPFYTSDKKGNLPFRDESFDVIWALNVHEHIPNLENALREIKRVLRPSGFIFFDPAWHVRPWAAQGYAVRPYWDFGLLGKLIKFSLPFREFFLFSTLTVKSLHKKQEDQV